MGKRILTIVLALAMCAACSLFCSADVFDSFSDGGSSGSSGSSGGSDWSAGNWGTSGGGFYIGGSSGDLDGDAGWIIVVVIAAVIIYGVVGAKKIRPVTGGSRNSAEQASAVQIDEQAVIARIQQRDPNFSCELFKSFVSDAFIGVQEAWESGDTESVRPLVTESMLMMLKRSLGDYESSGQTNHLDFQNVKSVTLADFHVDGGMQTLTVRIVASLVDYVTDREGNLIRGSKTDRQTRVYRTDFVRPADRTTTPRQKEETLVCPGCGAPVEANVSGKCAYCGCIVLAGTHDWAMNSYGKWNG